MKIYFVGMHNKEGMKPLDSRTVSGKIIDKCIGMLDLNWHYDSVKTNLCDVGYEPKLKSEIFWHANRWHGRIKPAPDSVAVLLGGWVSDNFMPNGMHIIKTYHPAWISIRGKSDWYVNSIKAQIDNIHIQQSINIYPALPNAC